MLKYTKTIRKLSFGANVACPLYRGFLYCVLNRECPLSEVPLYNHKRKVSCESVILYSVKTLVTTLIWQYSQFF